MFGRVAAWGFAAFLVVMPARIGVESAFADATVSAAALARTTSLDPAEIQNQSAETAGYKTTVETTSEETIVQVDIAPERQRQAPDEAQPRTKLASLDPAGPPLLAPRAGEPFGLAAIPVDDGEVLTKWRGVESGIRADNEILARCGDSNEHCPAAAQSFLAIVAQGRALSGRARIGVINRAINLAIQPMSDLAQWGVPDRWSAPLETFGTGRGDCEDYAIAKYVALTAAGVAVPNVKLVIVRNTTADEDHAVVAVRLDGNWIMLDNRWLTLVEADAMPDVIPLFVLDRDGVRRFAPPMLTARRAATPASLGF
jgi:predicted transglutaminase-like cysteine proteinase